MVLYVNVTSAVEVSIALTATKGFSSVINSVVSPGPTVTVGSPDGTLIEVQPSKGAHTAVSFDAASFTSTVLLSAQVSVQPTPVLTVKSTTTPSLKGKSQLWVTGYSCSKFSCIILPTSFHRKKRNFNFYM